MAKRGPKPTMKEKWTKQALAYIKKHKRLPPQTAALGRAVAGYRHRDPAFKRETDAALKRAGGKLQTDVAKEKRKAILSFINKNKRFPPTRHPLGLCCARFRFHDTKFKKASDAALKKAGVMTPQEAVRKKRKQILAYMKKHKKLPPQHTPLGYTAASYRIHDPEFKKETDAKRENIPGITLSEAVKKKRKQILAYIKKHKKLLWVR